MFSSEDITIKISDAFSISYSFENYFFDVYANSIVLWLQNQKTGKFRAEI